MRMLLRHPLRGAAALCLFLALAPGCDSVVNVELDAEFFRGNWQLESVRDGSGDRTEDVREVVDDLRLTFAADNTFTLRVIYVDATGQPDEVVSGTYSVSATGQLLLTVGEISIPFDATRVNDNTVELRAPAAIVEAVIATADIEIGLVGSVVLTLSRGGPGA